MKNANKPVSDSSAGPVFGKSELFRITVRPFDLMSRRHPLSSTGAAGLDFASKSKIVLTAPVTSPASSCRQFFRRGYFFLETFFVFFAVFFTALFAFFAFLAFLAMLPS